MSALLRDEERRVIEAVLRFANTSDKFEDYVGAVVRCFRDLVVFDPSVGEEHPPTAKLIMSFDDHENFRAIHAVVNDWLARATGPQTSRNQVAREVADELPKSIAFAPAFTFKAQQLRVSGTYWFPSVRAACIFALALILNEGSGLARRLTRCRYSKCQRFVCDLNLKRRKGHPLKYCPDHRVLYWKEEAAKKMREWRQSKARLVDCNS